MFFRRMKNIVTKRRRTDILRIPIVMPTYIWDDPTPDIGTTELGSLT